MAFSTKLKHRCWMITVHIANMENMNLTEEQYKDPKVLADILIDLWSNSGKNRKAGVSVCLSADGCYHAHIAAYSGNTTTLKAVADIFGQAHTEPQLSGKDTLKAYLEKEGKFAEKSEHVLYKTGLEVIEDSQGKRTDLEEIEELLHNGYTPKEIFEEAFKYRRYDKMIMAEYHQKRASETPLIKEMWTEFHWGDSGSGKTYTYIKLCNELGADNVYYCNDYHSNGYSLFDSYGENPVSVVVLDEFRGDIPYTMMLGILDCYSRVQLHCRYRNTYALWNKVYVMSILPPEEVYYNMVDFSRRRQDTFTQLKRRINKIVYHYKDVNGEYKTFEMLPDEYQNGSDMKKQAALLDAMAVVEDNYKEVKEGEQNDMLRRLDGSQIARLINYGTEEKCGTSEENDNRRD
ncbi:MAG: hypothetical protein IJC04_01585 [Oscillospiraceae bacterium]|nr:hypothetical protein [Oscillospiraceae bacterium]